MIALSIMVLLSDGSAPAWPAIHKDLSESVPQLVVTACKRCEQVPTPEEIKIELSMRPIPKRVIDTYVKGLEHLPARVSRSGLLYHVGNHLRAHAGTQAIILVDADRAIPLVYADQGCRLST